MMVTPGPKLQVVPATKLAPVRMTLAAWPCSVETGEREVKEGGARITRLTVKPPVRVADRVSTLVTVMSRVPGAAEADREIEAVSCVAELNAQEFTVMPWPKAQVAPEAKLEPIRTTSRDWPWSAMFGEAESSEGGG